MLRLDANQLASIRQGSAGWPGTEEGRDRAETVDHDRRSGRLSAAGAGGGRHRLGGVGKRRSPMTHASAGCARRSSTLALHLPTFSGVRGVDGDRDSHRLSKSGKMAARCKRRVGGGPRSAAPTKGVFVGQQATLSLALSAAVLGRPRGLPSTCAGLTSRRRSAPRTTDRSSCCSSWRPARSTAAPPGATRSRSAARPPISSGCWRTPATSVRVSFDAEALERAIRAPEHRGPWSAREDGRGGCRGRHDRRRRGQRPGDAEPRQGRAACPAVPR